MENLQDLFNLSVNDLIEKSSESKNSERWTPSADKGKEGVYSAVIRFIPWYKNTKKSIMKKWTCWLVDPLTGKGRYVDCPTTIGKKSPLQDMFFKLKNSESVAEQKLAERFSRKRVFASLIQVLKDDNAPETVGKILVWTFGVKIYNKIQDEMEPEFGPPHIPFDLFEGKPFHVKITKVAGYNNYDNCRFLDNPHPIVIDGVKMTKTPENMQKIVKFLQENSPDLSKYDYQEWNEETINYVNHVIQNTVPGGKIVENIIKSNQVQETQESLSLNETQKKPAKNQSLPEIDEPDFGLTDLDLDDTNFDDELYSDL